MRRIDTIVCHHSASTFGTALMIDSWHRERGWDGIGYHFVIQNGHDTAPSVYDPALDGWIELGRPTQKAGAHAVGNNAHSIGICLIGHGEFTERQFMSLVLLCRSLMAEYGVEAKRVVGHSELDPRKPECPGFTMELLRATLMGCREGMSIGED